MINSQYKIFSRSKSYVGGLSVEKLYNSTRYLPMFLNERSCCVGTISRNIYNVSPNWTETTFLCFSEFRNTGCGQLCLQSWYYKVTTVQYCMMYQCKKKWTMNKLCINNCFFSYIDSLLTLGSVNENASPNPMLASVRFCANCTELCSETVPFCQGFWLRQGNCRI